MQSNETDYDFIKRLLASEGVTTLIDEAQHQVWSSSEQIKPQKLRLIDDNAQFQALDRRNIRFHRSSSTERQDSITAFTGLRSLQPTAVHLQRWQADALAQEEGAGSVLTKHQHSDNQDVVSLGLEQAFHISPAWIQDLKGEDGATQSGNKQIEKLNENLSKYFNSQAKYFSATSTVRDAHVGYWFKFKEHPEIDQHEGSDQEFLITAKTFYNQNNLPKDLTDQVTALLKESHWQQPEIHTNNQDERQANNLILQRRNIDIVPPYRPLEDRPKTHPQRAKVVGVEGEADLIARKGIQIISTEDTVYITSPKELILTGGGSQLKINGSGIFPTTSGKFEVKAGQHKFVGGGSKTNYVLPHLPLTEIKKDDLVLEYLHSDGSPVKGAEFEVLLSDGSRKKGKLDDKGKAFVKGVPAGRAKIQYGEDQSEDDFPPHEIDDWFIQQDLEISNNNEN